MNFTQRTLTSILTGNYSSFSMFQNQLGGGGQKSFMVS